MVLVFCNECPLLSLCVVLVGRFLCMSLGKGEGGKRKIKKPQRDRKGEEEGRMFFFLGIPQGLLNRPLSQTG